MTRLFYICNIPKPGIYPNWKYSHLYSMAKRKEKIVYNRLREVLEDRGKSQTWLAEQMDLDFQTITRYVNNNRQPTLARLYEIAKILKVNPKELLNS